MQFHAKELLTLISFHISNYFIHRTSIYGKEITYRNAKARDPDHDSFILCPAGKPNHEPERSDGVPLLAAGRKHVQVSIED
jgi:hypothetical protein